MVIFDRTKGCCSIDLNEPPHSHHDQFAELDAHNSNRMALESRFSEICSITIGSQSALTPSSTVSRTSQPALSANGSECRVSPSGRPEARAPRRPLDPAAASHDLQRSRRGFDQLQPNPGWVAERFKAPVLKTGVPARVPWVRIPPHPPVGQ